MSENNQNPREYDAVLGGNNPPPVDGVVLGGIEGLQRRLETGSIQQRVESLPDAIKYSDAGIDLLIEALNDTEIEVRLKAFEILKNQNLEKLQQIVDKGIPLKKGDKLYCVYASDIDYDDSYYRMIDSLEKVEDSYYDTKPILIARYVYRNKAEIVAEDLHQTILRDLKLSEFIRRHNLEVDKSKINSLRYVVDYAVNVLCEFVTNELISILEINDFCIENDILVKSNSNEEESWEFQIRILNYLHNNQMYEQLSNFLELLQIGKFAFIEEEIVNQDGYLKYKVKYKC